MQERKYDIKPELRICNNDYTKEEDAKDEFLKKTTKIFFGSFFLISLILNVIQYRYGQSNDKIMENLIKSLEESNKNKNVLDKELKKTSEVRNEQDKTIISLQKQLNLEKLKAKDLQTLLNSYNAARNKPEQNITKDTRLVSSR